MGFPYGRRVISTRPSASIKAAAATRTISGSRRQRYCWKIPVASAPARGTPKPAERGDADRRHARSRARLGVLGRNMSRPFS
jgi:hypothetical protein